ncbi:MAG: gluconeogenesis factor YvcK family protein [Candidatus Woesearchaeota archaeon]
MINITTIGGGTGSFHLLLALKKIENIKISSIVSVSDDGGSTGLLRTMYGILPPGDIRNCLVALSNDVETWTKLFNYRFDEKLQKHSLGNLILTALNEIEGSFEKGLSEAHEILNIQDHEVIPATFEKTTLNARFKKEIVSGEENLTKHKHKTREVLRSLFLEKEDGSKEVRANPKAIQRILESDFIFIGPGSLYTSILVNLVLSDISKAINKSNAKVVYISNIMNGLETIDYSLSDYISKIERHISIDKILMNSKRPNDEILKEYNEKEEKKLVTGNNDDRIVRYDLLKDDNILRHDPDKLSKALHWIILNEEMNKDE